MSNKGPLSPQAIKRIVLEHLNRHKGELNDDSNTLKAAGIKLSGGRKGVPEGAVVMELLKGGRGADAAADREQREQLSSMIDGLVDNVQEDGERIVVVNVNTPAVDLQKDFAPEELKFIQDDIFKNIRQQLGAEFEQEVEDQWATAFSTIMDVVKEEKKLK